MIDQKKINFLKWLFIYSFSIYLVPGGLTFEGKKRDKLSHMLEEIFSYPSITFIMYFVVTFVISKDMFVALHISFLLFFIFSVRDLITHEKK